jgi:uncharacterized protein YkuJ
MQTPEEIFSKKLHKKRVQYERDWEKVCNSGYFTNESEFNVKPNEPSVFNFKSARARGI